MKRVDVEIYHNKLTSSVEQLSIKELEKVFEILEKHVCITDIYVEKIIVVYRATEEIDVEDISALESYEGNGIYKVRVHASLEHVKKRVLLILLEHFFSKTILTGNSIDRLTEISVTLPSFQVSNFYFHLCK